jgi:hypothetical protein
LGIEASAERVAMTGFSELDSISLEPTSSMTPPPVRRHPRRRRRRRAQPPPLREQTSRRRDLPNPRARTAANLNPPPTSTCAPPRTRCSRLRRRQPAATLVAAALHTRVATAGD